MASLPARGSYVWDTPLNEYLGVEMNTDGTLRNVARPSDVTAKYTKPSDGIPKTDLSNDVQAALDLAGSGGVADATTVSKGVVQLAGDLAGTADAPTVPGLANKVSTSDARLSDQRTPVDGSVTTAKIAGGGIAQSAVTGLSTTLTGLRTDVDSVTTNFNAYKPVVQWVFSMNGPIGVRVGGLRLRNPGRAITISKVYIDLGTAPVGAAAIVDVNKNGTTIYTTQANRPTVADGANTGNSTPDVTSFGIGDYITVDIDQIGSTTSGSDLTVSIVGA